MPTLLVMAAGVGSRYGGLKQLDPMGPGGENLLDFSVWDALKAGFDRLVFVIRKDMEEPFERLFLKKYRGKVPIQLVFQELSQVPKGFIPPPERQKPWGTGHAVLVCKDVVHEPFCVINADDYYGPAAFHQMARFFSRPKVEGDADPYSLVGFLLKNTLSEAGAVSRGLCEVGPESLLSSVTELEKIERRQNSLIEYQDAWGRCHPISDHAIVSMNFWGFTPRFFKNLDEEFESFLLEHGKNPKAEFFLPTVVDRAIRRKEATVLVLKSEDLWVGVTYPKDKERVKKHLAGLVEAGVYPKVLDFCNGSR